MSLRCPSLLQEQAVVLVLIPAGDRLTKRFAFQIVWLKELIEM